jgi:hypothetical protein
MKKIYYSLLLLTLAFTACQKQPNLVPSSYTKAMAFTLQQSDYQLLPSKDYPYSTFSFDNVADAKLYIPMILNARDPQLGNGSTAKITYTTSSPYFKLTDSVYADVAYTLTNADYLLLPGNTYTDFSTAQILSWLPYKYPTPVANQLALLTYTYYQSGATPSAGVPATGSFLYLNGAWKPIYTLSAAQYTALGRGSYNEIISADNANLPAYFNTFLKNDPTIADTAKAGDIEYVSFKYYAKPVTAQRVLPLIFDGSNWVTTPTTTNTLSFVKSGGTWIPDPTVYYTLTSADTKLIAASTIGTAAERTNLGSYGDFSGWAAADLNSAMILVLTTDFPKPTLNINYKVTYLNYTGGNDVPTVLTFTNNGTAWSAVTQ